MTNSYFLLTCFLAASYLQYGDCTKCYQCTSLTDPDCGDPMKPDTSKAVQCTSDALKKTAEIYNLGMKKLADFGASFGINMPAKPVDANLQCMKIDVIEGNKKMSMRSCAMPPTSNFDPCKQTTDKIQTDSVKVSYCQTCDTDFCNGATQSLHISAVFILPIIALLLSQYN